MSHRHGGHHHGSSHPVPDFGPAFLIGVVLNLGFVAAEVGFGLLSGSLALLSDAGHNLNDVFSLLMAWGALALAGRAATLRHTFGLGRVTILSALASAVLLFVAVGVIAWEAVQRVLTPGPVGGITVIVVAAIGVGVNGFTAWLFRSGQDHDLNVRGAYLHMLADAAVSLGVVVAGVGVLLFGWLWLDPLVSLVIAAVIAISSWRLFRDSLNLAVDAVPRGIDPSKVRQYLRGQVGVVDVHDLHIWGLSTTETALTAHLVIPDATADDSFLIKVRDGLRQRFNIGHVTLQIEVGDTGLPRAEAERCL